MYTGQRVSDFRDRFNILFEESGKTNSELGKELHVSNQTISAWKLGVRSPKAPTVIAIASYFHVSVQWLLGFDVQKQPHDPMTDGAQQLRSPIIIPDSERFLKLVHYMTQEEYVAVSQAFFKASVRMEEMKDAKGSETTSGPEI